jgi:hypothetical protein
MGHLASYRLPVPAMPGGPGGGGVPGGGGIAPPVGGGGGGGGGGGIVSPVGGGGAALPLGGGGGAPVVEAAGSAPGPFVPSSYGGGLTFLTGIDEQHGTNPFALVLSSSMVSAGLGYVLWRRYVERPKGKHRRRSGRHMHRTAGRVRG